VAVRYDADSIAGCDECPRLEPGHATLIGDIGLAIMEELPDVTHEGDDERASSRTILTSVPGGIGFRLSPPMS